MWHTERDNETKKNDKDGAHLIFSYPTTKHESNHQNDVDNKAN